MKLISVIIFVAFSIVLVASFPDNDERVSDLANSSDIDRIAVPSPIEAPEEGSNDAARDVRDARFLKKSYGKPSRGGHGGHGGYGGYGGGRGRPHGGNHGGHHGGGRW